MTARTIIHIDMDSFFVAVEQVLDPRLRGGLGRYGRQKAPREWRIGRRVMRWVRKHGAVNKQSASHGG